MLFTIVDAIHLIKRHVARCLTALAIQRACRAAGHCWRRARPWSGPDSPRVSVASVAWQHDLGAYGPAGRVELHDRSLLLNAPPTATRRLRAITRASQHRGATIRNGANLERTSHVPSRNTNAPAANNPRPCCCTSHPFRVPGLLPYNDFNSVSFVMSNCPPWSLPSPVRMIAVPTW